MTYKLFLDDERDPRNVTWVASVACDPHGWTIVRNYKEFVNTILDRGLPEEISFDHDLADEHYVEGFQGIAPRKDYKEKTGYDCARWLVDYCQEHNRRIPPYSVHSLNPVGRANITGLLYQASILFNEH